MSDLCENDLPVKVVIRPLPIQSEDISDTVVKYEPKSSNIIIIDERPFVFDEVFNPTVGQQELFNNAIQPLVQKVLKGFNCTALAYGQTGTGKSYTMGLNEKDDEQHVGIVRRCLNEIMQANAKCMFDIKVSFVEIYNEKVFDLLSANPNEPIMSKGFKYPGGTRQSIYDMADCNEILRQGVSKRHVRPTNMNSESSRSHVIVTIEVTSKVDLKPSRAYLNLVDLAGSEGVRRTGHTGKAMSEGVHINQGLLCIGKILQAMSEGKKVIPFRDSVLGAVLQDSLNANAYLTLLACISSKRLDLSETLSTIRFAQRAKQLKLTPQINSIMAELNKNKPKTPFNSQVTQFTKPSKTPFKRRADENQISNTFCTPAKERRLDNQFNHTDIGLTPKEKQKAEKNFQTASKPTFLLPPPMARSSTVHSTAQRESVFEQTIDSWALNASTLTVTAFEVPSCIDKPISYSPIVQKCVEKLGSVLEDKMQKIMQGLIIGNTEFKTPQAQNREHTFKQQTIRSELKSILNEMMTERKAKTPTKADGCCSSPPKASAKCQLFTTSSPVFKIPEIPTRTQPNLSTLQASNDSINYSMIENTVRPARRSTRLQSRNMENTQFLCNSNINRNVRRSIRLQELQAFDDSLIQRDSRNETSRSSTRRRSKSVPTDIEQTKPKTKKQTKSNKHSVYDNLVAAATATSSKALNITKHRKAILDLLNQGSMKDLQMLPQIGVKTAYQLVTQRTLNGKFRNLAQVESLPMWRGNGWKRFLEANSLV